LINGGFRIVALGHGCPSLPSDIERITEGLGPIGPLIGIGHVDRYQRIYYASTDATPVPVLMRLDPATGSSIHLAFVTETGPDCRFFFTPSGNYLLLATEERWFALAQPDAQGRIQGALSRRKLSIETTRYPTEEYMAVADDFFAVIGRDHDRVYVVDFSGEVRATLKPPAPEDHPHYRFIEFEQICIDAWERIWVSDGGCQVLVFSADGDLLYVPPPDEDLVGVGYNTGWSFMMGIDLAGRLWIRHFGDLWGFEFPELVRMPFAPALGGNDPDKRTGLEPSL
jgi:hypothetical protein